MVLYLAFLTRKRLMDSSKDWRGNSTLLMKGVWRNTLESWWKMSQTREWSYCSLIWSLRYWTSCGSTTRQTQRQCWCWCQENSCCNGRLTQNQWRKTFTTGQWYGKKTSLRSSPDPFWCGCASMCDVLGRPQAVTCQHTQVHWEVNTGDWRQIYLLGPKGGQIVWVLGWCCRLPRTVCYRSWRHAPWQDDSSKIKNGGIIDYLCGMPNHSMGI